MFLEKLRERNPNLLARALDLHAAGKIRPDTWLIDMDALLNNASLILKEAEKYGITLYYPTKQFGRNPVIAKKLQKLGYAGASAVDFKEASVLLKNKIPLGHVGHVVQIPDSDIPRIIKARPEAVTVFSHDKAERISEAALKEGWVQSVLFRIWDEKFHVILGQEAGFTLQQLEGVLWALPGLTGVRAGGVTSFPCFLYDDNQKDIVPTENVRALARARIRLERYLPPSSSIQVNMPSLTCVRSMPLIADAGGTHGEPEHALTGMSPLHLATDQPEIPAMVYVTEVSHHWGRSSMVYGGGRYQRGLLRNALVADRTAMVYPSDPSIVDYHFEIDGQFPIGTPVLMAFRTQAFATRSDIALVQGIHNRKLAKRVLGVFTPSGDRIAL